MRIASRPATPSGASNTVFTPMALSIVRTTLRM